MRGSDGYPKGKPYSTAPQGLLLRPAIPSNEIFGVDNTYGPKANFKISVRELPNTGRFRVTVVAAKYRDGLLLDSGAKQQPETADAVIIRDPKTPQTVFIPKTGIYQVDIHVEEESARPPDVSRLNEGLTGIWPKEGEAGVVDSPFGKAVSLNGESGGLVVPRQTLPTDDAHNVGEGDFTVAAVDSPRASSGSRELSAWATRTGRKAGSWICLTLAALCGFRPPAGKTRRTRRSRLLAARFARTRGSTSRW